MPSPELGAGPTGPTPEPSAFGPLDSSNPLPSGMQSPELGAGPKALLAAAVAQNTVIVNIATIAIMLINFFISITTYDGTSSHSNLRDTLKQAFQKQKHPLPKNSVLKTLFLKKRKRKKEGLCG